MRPSQWVGVLGFALVLTNAAWAYVSLNRGVAMDHQSDELVRRGRTTALLASLVLELPREASLEEAARFLRSRYPEDMVKVEGSTIEVGEVTVEYRNGRLAAVTPF